MKVKDVTRILELTISKLKRHDGDMSCEFFFFDDNGEQCDLLRVKKINQKRGYDPIVFVEGLS